MNHITVIAVGAEGSPARRIQESPVLAIDALQDARRALTMEPGEPGNWRASALEQISGILDKPFLKPDPTPVDHHPGRGISPGSWSLGSLGAVVSDTRDARIGGDDDSRRYYGGEVICESAIDGNRAAIMHLPHVVAFLNEVAGAPEVGAALRSLAVYHLKQMGCRE